MPCALESRLLFLACPKLFRQRPCVMLPYPCDWSPLTSAPHVPGGLRCPLLHYASVICLGRIRALFGAWLDASKTLDISEAGNLVITQVFLFFEQLQGGQSGLWFLPWGERELSNVLRFGACLKNQQKAWRNRRVTGGQLATFVTAFVGVFGHCITGLLDSCWWFPACVFFLKVESGPPFPEIQAASYSPKMRGVLASKGEMPGLQVKKNNVWGVGGGKRREMQHDSSLAASLFGIQA